MEDLFVASNVSSPQSNRLAKKREMLTILSHGGKKTGTFVARVRKMYQLSVFLSVTYVYHLGCDQNAGRKTGKNGKDL